LLGEPFDKTPISVGIEPTRFRVPDFDPANFIKYPARIPLPSGMGRKRRLLSYSPLAGAGFCSCRASQLPPVSRVKFPSTKLDAGTFPRVALSRTPSNWLTTQVAEQ